MSLISIIHPNKEKEDNNRELLQECLRALKHIPKKILPSGKYADTHQLASEIHKTLKDGKRI